MTPKDKIRSILNEHDKRQSKRAGYNPYALGIYFEALDSMMPGENDPLPSLEIAFRYFLPNNRGDGFELRCLDRVGFASEGADSALRWRKSPAKPEGEKTTRYGWPMVPVICKFPDHGVQQWEWSVQCPECGKTGITLDSIGAGIGSGPGGRHRMGDNFRSRVTCNSCGHSHIGEEMMHQVNGPCVPVGKGAES